jgi:hypothetical protein
MNSRVRIEAVTELLIIAAAVVLAHFGFLPLSPVTSVQMIGKFTAPVVGFRALLILPVGGNPPSAALDPGRSVESAELPLSAPPGVASPQAARPDVIDVADLVKMLGPPSSEEVTSEP